MNNASTGGISSLVLAALMFWLRPDGTTLCRELAMNKLMRDSGNTGQAMMVNSEWVAIAEAEIAPHVRGEDMLVATLAYYNGNADNQKSLLAIGVLGHVFVF